jgi:hypothetical protein
MNMHKALGLKKKAFIVQTPYTQKIKGLFVESCKGFL